MKYVNKISLRMRITVLSGAVLIICSIIITVAASYNAASQLNNLLIPTTGTPFSAADGNYEIAEHFNIAEPGFVESGLLTTAKRQFNNTSVIILAIVCVVGTFMVYAVAGQSLYPIHQLSEVVSSITDKNLNCRIENMKRNDEVGSLAKSFNGMLENLESSFSK